MKKNKTLYLEIMRILACLLVLLNHTISFVNPISNLGVVLKDFLFMGCKIAVPLFLMISGYLLLSKDYSYRQILVGKILRIFVVLIVIVSLVYFKHYNYMTLKDYIIQIVSKPTPVLFWYLYVLVGLYAMIPFLKKMVNSMSDKDYLYFFLITLAIPGIIPLIKILFSFDVSDYFTEALFSGYVGYFVLGYYLGNKKINLKLFIYTFIIGILFYLVSVGWLFVNYKNTGVNTLFLDNVLFLTTIMPSIASFIIVKKIFENKHFGKFVDKIIVEIGGTTFGVYIFHILVMLDFYFSSPIQKLYNYNQFLAIFVLVGCMFTSLSLFTYFLKKIPIVKKYL